MRRGASDSGRTRIRARVLVWLCALTFGATEICGGPAAASPTDPAQQNWNSAFGYWLAHPGATPPGMNDASCVPSPDHPRPVILVNGMFESKYVTWSYLAPRLQKQGYCVYGLDYGRGTGREVPLLQVGPLRRSAAEIGRFVDHVRQQTGADTVDLVGHSEGGLVPLYFINHLGGAAKVHNMIGIAPITNGVSLYGFLTWLRTNPSLEQGVGDALPIVREGTVGSDFVTATSRGGMTRPGVRYLTISSRHDLVVTTRESALPLGPTVTNTIIQDLCPTDRADHNTVVYDENIASVVDNRLAGRPLTHVSCRPVEPFTHNTPPA